MIPMPQQRFVRDFDLTVRLGAAAAKQPCRDKFIDDLGHVAGHLETALGAPR